MHQIHHEYASCYARDNGSDIRNSKIPRLRLRETDAQMMHESDNVTIKN